MADYCQEIEELKENFTKLLDDVRQLVIVVNSLLIDLQNLRYDHPRKNDNSDDDEDDYNIIPSHEHNFVLSTFNMNMDHLLFDDTLGIQESSIGLAKSSESSSTRPSKKISM